MLNFSSELDFQFPAVPNNEPITSQYLAQTLTFILRLLAEQLGAVHYTGDSLPLLIPADTVKQANQNRIWVLAGEDLAIGDLVALGPNSQGKLVATKATHSNFPKGFCFAIAGVEGYVGVSIFAGTAQVTAGLIPGSIYYLGVAPGSVTSTPPSSGYTKPVGFALGANTLFYMLQL